jgi:hypothetical protein
MVRNGEFLASPKDRWFGMMYWMTVKRSEVNVSKAVGVRKDDSSSKKIM